MFPCKYRRKVIHYSKEFVSNKFDCDFNNIAILFQEWFDLTPLGVMLVHLHVGGRHSRSAIWNFWSHRPSYGAWSANKRLGIHDWCVSKEMIEIVTWIKDMDIVKIVACVVYFRYTGGHMCDKLLLCVFWYERHGGGFQLIALKIR